eukprot:2264290-Rhodomonas_salina.2
MCHGAGHSDFGWEFLDEESRPATETPLAQWQRQTRRLWPEKLTKEKVLTRTWPCRAGPRPCRGMIFSDRDLRLSVFHRNRRTNNCG